MRRGFIGAPCCSRRKEEQKPHRCPCWLPEVGRACSFYGVGWEGVCPGFGPGGWVAQVVYPRLCGVGVPAGMCSALVLLPALQNGSWVFWAFCILLSIICPNCTSTGLFFRSFYSVLYFVARGDICPAVITGRKVPKSQVPACLKINILQNCTLEQMELACPGLSPLPESLASTPMPGP